MTPYAAFILTLGCLAAYLAGSIPFGLVLGRLFGIGDIRKIGSGNIGATNMLRTGRKGLAALTLMLDFAKGILGVVMAQAICNYLYATRGDFTTPLSVLYPAGAAAVVGHVYPVWLRFKGGKGVATTLGVLLATQPLIGVLTCIGWLVLFYLTRTSSLASIGSIVCAPILGYMYIDGRFASMALVLAVIVVAKHRDNILRLRRGEEDKWEKRDDLA